MKLEIVTSPSANKVELRNLVRDLVEVVVSTKETMKSESTGGESEGNMMESKTSLWTWEMGSERRSNPPQAATGSRGPSIGIFRRPQTSRTVPLIVVMQVRWSLY